MKNPPDTTQQRREIAVVTGRPAQGATLAVASAGTLLVLMAFTVPVATLTSTAVALGAGPGAQAWILSAMSVGAAAGLLGSGAIGDDYGRRRIFLAGMLLLAVSSVLGAVARTTLVLVITRILQGMDGAAVIECSMAVSAPPQVCMSWDMPYRGASLYEEYPVP